MLPGENFCRVHNSYNIDVNGVKKYQKGRGGILEMENGAMMKVAIRRRDKFLARFGW